MAEAYIIDAVRSPVGKRGGGLSHVHPPDLGAFAHNALVERTGIDPGAVDDDIFGTVDSLGPQAGDIARTCRLEAGLPEHAFRDAIAQGAYEEAGLGPDDLDLAEVYDLSSALELDWYENIGLCGEGEAEALLRSGATTVGGRIPVNPSGGLACFGEAIPAQAIAQVCEVVWQLRGEADGRQVEGATVGVTANQGLFGHGSSVIVST